MYDHRSPILLVEDEPQFIYLLERYADRSGYRLVHTDQDCGILALAQQVQPVVVILDLGVPNMDIGLVITLLRCDGMTRHIPIILCSSSEAALRAWEPEVDSCWLKPILYDDFTHTLGAINVRDAT